MKLEEFSEFVIKHTLEDKNIFFTSNALLGELGELANVIKKEEFHQDFKSYQQKVEDQIKAGIRKPFSEMFIDEAGDTFFYFIQLLNKHSVDLKEVINYQVNKLDQQDLELGRIFKK